MASEMMQYMARIGIDDSAFNPTLEGMANKLLAFTTSSTAGFAAIAVAAGLVVQKFQEMAQSAHEMEELSAVIGVSTLELQKFQYAAALAGESANAYDGMISKLTLGMGKAKDAASEQAKAFAQLGVNPEGKSTDQVFVEVFQRLQKIDDAATRAELSMTLFGRSWVEAGKLGNHYLENLDKINSATYKQAEDIEYLAEKQDQWNSLLADGGRNTENFLVALGRLSDQTNILAKAYASLTHYQQISNNELALSGTGFKQGIDRAPSGIDATLASESALFSQVANENKLAAAQELSALNAQYNSGGLSKDEYNKARASLANGYVSGGAALLSGGAASGGSSMNYDQGMSAGYFGGYGVNASPALANGYQLSQVDRGAIRAMFNNNIGMIDDREYIIDQMTQSQVNLEALSKPKSQAEAWAMAGYTPGTNITIVQYNSGNATPSEIANATAESVDRLLAGA